MTISATMNTSATGSDLLTKFRSVQRDGDTNPITKSFDKTDALNLGIDKATFTSSTVKAKLGGINISYNNSSGAITWGEKKLNLTGFDPRTEPTLYLQEGDAGKVNIYREKDGPGFVLDLATGKLETESDGGYKKAGAFSDTTAALIINNSTDWYGDGASTTGTNVGDVIINRQAGGKIDAGGGNDQIFNYGTGAVELAGGGGGNDALYTIANSGGTFDLSDSDDAYVKTLGSMTGSTVKLGTGKGLFDATGYTLTDMTIDSAGSATSAALIAKSIAGAGSIELTAGQVGIDVTTLSGELTLGAGKNSLVADTVTGKVTSTGTDSFQFKTVSTNTEIDQSGGITSSVINVTGAAKEATFDFGKGENVLNAVGKTLTSVDISDVDDGGTETEILAGSITGVSGNESDIALNTAATITVSGAINYTKIETGDGDNTITAKTISNSAIDMKVGGASAIQTISVTGKIDNTKLDMATNANATNNVTAGSTNLVEYIGGAGADNVAVKGAVNASTFDLAAGANKFYATSTGVAGGKGQAITNSEIKATGVTTIEGGAFTAGADYGSIALGDAAHTVTLSSVSGKATGDRATITLGGLTSTEDQNLTITGAVKNLTYTGSKGNDTIIIEGATSTSNFILGDGTNSLTAQKGSAAYQAMNDVDISSSGAAAADKTTITAGAYTAGNSDSANNSIKLEGAGENVVTLNSVTGKKVGATTYGLGITLGDDTGTRTQSLHIKGATKDLTYNGSDGIDTILLEGATSNSSFNLGGGDNTLTAKKGATAQAMNSVDISSTGTGATTIEAGAYTAGSAGANNSIKLEGTGENVVQLNSVTGKNVGGTTYGLAMTLGGAVNNGQKLDILGAVKDLTYTGADGADLITINGAVSESKFDLGDGDDTFTAERNGTGQKLTNVGIDAGDGTAIIKAGAYTVTDKVTSNYGTITLGAGAATINLGSITGGKTEKATITGGAGAVGLTVSGTVNMLNYTSGAGADSLSLGGAISKSTFALGAGANEFTAEKTMTDVTFTSGGDNDSITLKGAVSKSTFELGDGDNELDASKQTLTDVAIKGGTGKDIIKYGAYKGTKDTTHKIELGGGTENTIEIVA